MTQIYSAAGLLQDLPYIATRPFRSPHQTASPVAVFGGGSSPRPGEISLAHRGVLFLDEVPEFRRDLLEALRQPLESGRAIITRIKSNLEFPARFMLAAAMNPCPCGYYGDTEKACKCNMHEILRYEKKISGPLLDRIDLQLVVPRLSLAELSSKPADSRAYTKQLRERVARARDRQAIRLKNLPRTVLTNAEMSSKEVDDLIQLAPEAKKLLQHIFDQELVSARGYYRILKTAQTIADLDGTEEVTKDNVSEAFQYRLKEEKKDWR